MTNAVKKYASPKVPIIGGVSPSGANLGFGMAWQPGGDIATERLQAVAAKVRLYYPENPAATSFEVQVSFDPTFTDEAVTSAAAAATFTVTDDVAELQFSQFDATNPAETLVLLAYAGETLYLRVRETSSDPWSRVMSTTIYFPERDVFELLSELPNPRNDELRAGALGEPLGVIFDVAEGNLTNTITVLGSATATGFALVRAFADGSEVDLAPPQTVGRLAITNGDTPTAIATALAALLNGKTGRGGEVTLAANTDANVVVTECAIGSDVRQIGAIDIETFLA